MSLRGSPARLGGRLILHLGHEYGPASLGEEEQGQAGGDVLGFFGGAAAYP